MQRFPVVGITGGVGCGKSEVGRILTELGVNVLDTDEVTHGLLQGGTSMARAIAARFGSDVVSGDGGIDRSRLAEIVFVDTTARRDLEALVHPAVLQRMAEWVETQRSLGPAAVLVPLLFEAGCAEGWDAIWCVSAEPEVVKMRLQARGWSEAHWQARQAAQWPLREKEQRADRIVRNNGSREELGAAVRQAWSEQLKWRT